MIKRRDILATLVAAMVGPAGLARATMPASTGKRRIPWRNWSGSQVCRPLQRVAPASVEDLQVLVAEARGTVRPVGAGHSFTALVPTDDTMVSLSRLSGVVDVDKDRLQATLWGGSRLGDIGRPLEAMGQAMVNMPDIDEQSLAGCLATATHGTGADIGCMSTFVTGMQLVNSRGDVVECDAQHNAELFQAAKVSLGALGIVTQVKVQNVAPYRLRREVVWHEFEALLDSAEAMADRHRNFEFFYLPFSGMGFTDVHDLTQDAIGATEKVDPNEGVMELKLARDWLEDYPWLRELILGSYMRTIADEVTVERSWKNYASERNVRFNEMEYHLPREHGLQALREVRETLEARYRAVFFPIEVRYTKGDDIWLSPFYGRDCISIAVHRYFDEDYTAYFKSIEPIFVKYGGRPHWGKINTLRANDLRKLYPRWHDFLTVRREMDPVGKFLNPYLAGLFR
ncbi:MAG: FAD-binding protein [Halioglobus sp.]|nr:FAD-binding protein [Halioglobus sp.]